MNVKRAQAFRARNYILHFLKKDNIAASLRNLA
jgi:hypothetical protein